MYTLILNKSKILKLCEFLLLLALPLTAWSLESDKDQPIEIEADTGELDDIKNISIYRGNVITQQGTIYMTGDKMTVYYTEDDEMDHLIMEGRPATYRQLPDDSSVYDYAEALTIEHYELKEYVILIDEALVTQEGLRFSGDRIEYDTRLSQVKAWSNKTTTSPNAEKAEPKKKERVKIIIRKKKDNCANKDYENSLDDAQLIIFKRECEKKKAEEKEE
jgi:lipopolysaccharide export system protein LptA